MSEAITLASPIQSLRGVGPELSQRLGRLGVQTIQDLIELLPRRVEDRSQLRQISQLTQNTPLVITGTIEKVSSRVSQRGVFIISAKIEDASGSITALWFNQRFLLSVLRPGRTLTLYGEKRPIKSMGYPFIVKKIIEQPEIAPIYPLTQGLTQAALAKLMRDCRSVIHTLPDVLPEPVRVSAELPTRAQTLAAAHFAPTEETLERAIELLGYEELFLTCLAAITAKRARQKQPAAVSIADDHIPDTVLTALGISPTASQRLVASEILHDLKQPYPMNRLLYGEVGSGKTAVGLIAAATVALTGKKVLWLSPTVTLANQQSKVTRAFCDHLDLQTALLTAATKDSTQAASVIVGTHALLHAKTKLGDVGLVIIDEQQRFGVEQRNQLLRDYPGVHLLMLSATPIPRTLAHTLFGHLDISYLTEKPSHQHPVTTRIFRDAGRQVVEQHIQKRLSAGQPGFVICPLIDADTAVTDMLFEQERKTVNAEYKRLQKVFPGARVGLIHGKLANDEKTEVMRRFHDGEIDILVATSVVEVGIDNPAATWILIEEADRFGLSQLHQLRGRVGRGDRPSVCFLHNSLSTEQATARLNALLHAQNGLEIAEIDLRFRGPGDIAGHDQSGLPGIRYASLGDAELVRSVYRRAEEFGSEHIGEYPELARAIRRITNNGLAAT